MFTYSERDMHRMPSPAKTHLPIKPEIISSGVMEDDNVGRDSEVGYEQLKRCQGKCDRRFSPLNTCFTG
jgi:ChAPs (Chs5p-Arf1p-binding proteins)